MRIYREDKYGDSVSNVSNLYSVSNVTECAMTKAGPAHEIGLDRRVTLLLLVAPVCNWSGWHGWLGGATVAPSKDK